MKMLKSLALVLILVLLAGYGELTHLPVEDILIEMQERYTYLAFS